MDSMTNTTVIICQKNKCQSFSDVLKESVENKKVLTIGVITELML